MGDFGRRAVSERPASPEPSTVNAAANRRQAVEAVFDARSRAVLDRDKSAFLELIDPTATEFRARQERLYDQLATIPFSSWSYELREGTPELAAERKQQLPEDARIVQVTLHYTFQDSPSPVDRDQYFTLVPNGDGWLLAEDQDTTSTGARSERDIWDLGNISVVSGARSLVIGHGTRDELSRFAHGADRAVRDVMRVWKPAWPRRAVVLVPRTQADMATIIDTGEKGLDQIAAVTTGHSRSGPTRGDRVVINPSAWPQLNGDGRRVVMTHEVTHLATRASTYRAVPTWMSEGFSDYVAYSAVDVSKRVVARDLMAVVRDGKTPKSLPANDDFDASRGDLGPAYEGAWLACHMIAERYGEQKLVELYLALADTTEAPVDADLREVLGISLAQLTADWKRYLQGVAAE